MLKVEDHIMLGGGLVKVFVPKVNYYINLLQNNNLYFFKMNHAWWQYLAGMRFWIAQYNKYHDKELMEEVKSIIGNIHETDIIMAVSNIGPLYDIGKNKKRDTILEKIILQYMPKNYQPHFGGIWKKYSLDKSINKFFESVKNFQITVVGFEHLQELKQSLNFDNFNFYKLSYDSSRNEKRHKVLSDLLEIANSNNYRKVFLIQAGELFATWLVYHLRKNVSNHVCSFVDMGRALDMFCPNRTFHEDIRKFGFYDFKKQLWMGRK